MSKFVSGYGAAQPKSGKNAMVLSRPSGYSATMAAFHSKTRSRYRGSSKHYKYESCGDYSGNDNLRGLDSK